MTIAITVPGLAAGVVPSEGWRLIEASDPALVATWEAARDTYDRHERGFQDRAAAWQRRAGAIRRRPRSEYAKALAVAEAAVAAKIEELIRDGTIVYAGHREGDLGDEPEPIPLALLAGRRPRGLRFECRGVVFHEVKLYPAQGVKGPGRPIGRARAPKDADDRLRAWLGDVDTSQTIQEITAEIAAAHPEIRKWWAESTALKRVGALLPVRANDFRLEK